MFPVVDATAGAFKRFAIRKSSGDYKRIRQRFRQAVRLLGRG
jgi:hypothetical protein